jgi:cellobiose-specific phosphotransferase system component IIA
MKHQDLPGATTHYVAAAEISKSLLKESPTNYRFHRDRCVALCKLTDVRIHKDEVESASEAITEAHAIARHLVERDRTNTQFQHDLFWSTLLLGRVLLASGKAAQQQAQDAHNIIRKLVSTDPNNAQWQSDLKTAHNFLIQVTQ